MNASENIWISASLSSGSDGTYILEVTEPNTSLTGTSISGSELGWYMAYSNPSTGISHPEGFPINFNETNADELIIQSGGFCEVRAIYNKVIKSKEVADSESGSFNLITGSNDDNTFDFANPKSPTEDSLELNLDYIDGVCVIRA